jgi:hypothetical protein
MSKLSNESQYEMLKLSIKTKYQIEFVIQDLKAFMSS